MDDQNRLRLERIASRHAKHAAGGRGPEPTAKPGPDMSFLAAFGRLRDQVLRPVMAEVGLQLKTSGYSFEVRPGGQDGAPAVDFHVVIPDRGDSKDTIRFLAHNDDARGWQVVAELDLKRSPVELTRFETCDEITRDVAEHLIVEAVEQMFASTSGGAPSEPPEVERSARAPQAAVPVERHSPQLRSQVGEIGETGEVDISAFRGALPFRRGSPAPTFFADAAAAHVAPDDDASGHETMTLAAIKVPPTDAAKAATPFVSPAARSRPDARGAGDPPVAPKAGRPPDTSHPRSPFPPVDQDPAAGTALAPSVQRALDRTPSAPRPTPASTHAPEAHARRSAGAPAMGETEDVDVRVFRRPAVPFAAGAPAPAFFATADQMRAQALAADATATGDETMALPVLTDAPTGASATSGLSTEQYAALCAEVTVFPHETADIEMKYGLAGPGARKALDEGFAARFHADEDLAARWRALVAHYVDWYRGRSGPRGP